MPRLGLGLGMGVLRGIAASASNIVAPAIDAIAYPGGAYTAFEGLWSGMTSTEMRLESSVNGVSGWTDEGVLPSVGTWASGLASKYLRLAVTAQPGAVVAYSAVFGPLGLALNQVLSFAGNTNRLSHAVTAPFIGADLAAGTSGAAAPGFWIQSMWYYSGSGLEAGASLVSIGDVASGLTGANLQCESTLWRAGGASSNATIAGAIAAAGWYLSTGYFYNSSTNHISELFLQDRSALGNTAGGAIALTNFTTLYIGDQANNAPTNATNFDGPMAYVAFGRGDPAAAHAWAYNSGQLRRVDGYNFAADADATLDGFILLSRVSPGNTTFAIGEVVDTVGAFDSWSLTGTLAWTDRLPGFISAAGDPPATPSRFIYPKYASTGDATFTLCINTKKIGEAVAGDFTITSLTHSVAGDISGTVTGTTFPNPGVGTISGTISGVSVSAEIIAPLAMPSVPQFSSRFDGNALAAGIETYPATGAGTTYADVTALKAGIDALALGGTLTINDLAATGSTLTLTAKDYGGATLIAKNLHGVALSSVVMTGVVNLTVRGFSVVNTFNSVSGTNGVTLDHCTGRAWDLRGTSGATETITITNWIGVDDGTAVQATLGKFNRVTLKRVAHGNTSTTAGDVCRTDSCNILIADRVYFGKTGNTNPDAHVDAWQTYLSGTSGTTGGLIMNSVLIDRMETGEVGAQGLFLTGIDARHLRFLNCAVFSSLTNSITMGPVSSGCGIENCTGNAAVFFHTGSAANSCYAKDNVRDTGGNVLPTAGTGTEIGTVKTAMASVYPQFNTFPNSWRMYENPTGAAVGKGAHALIAELAAI